jgi:shikimate dehydrogenase
VWLVGVGGGGSAIAAALAEAGVQRLYLSEAVHFCASAVAARLATFYPKLPVAIVETPPQAVDFAINATPCGLKPSDPSPFDPEQLAYWTIVCDIIMKPWETALLAAARRRGLAVHHGQHMLDAQIPMYLEFLGIAYPDERAIIDIAGKA